MKHDSAECLKEIVLQTQGQSQKIRAAVFEQGNLMEVFEEVGGSSQYAGGVC